MKILQISSSSNSKFLRRVLLAEKLPFFMKNVTPGGSQHPLAEELYSVILLLYKGQEEKQTCSEKAMLKACSDLLNNGIAEWQDRTPRRFADLDNDILKEAIWRLLDIETSEELKSHLLSTHLKVAVKRVCGGEYSQAIGAALMQIEHDLTNHSGISSSVWSAAMKFTPADRKRILGISPVKDNGHEISGVRPSGYSSQRQGEPQRRDDCSSVHPDFALSQQ